ncbi:LUD domain-containing protein [Halomarina rubra]|uniref:LUD domain-containing protein n=1 Tax=Halomarina rubra TaxID=2071873 RepID=A0ABD6AZR9_9EURY|nr:LUD domain-containing protein [Halomarina rubra]
MSTTPRSTLDRFVERLDRLDVTHTVTDRDGVTAAVDAVCEPPAVGVPLPDGLGTLPASVATDVAPSALGAATTGVTPATLGVADYGSVVLSTTPDGVEPTSLFPDLHVAVLPTGAVVPDMATALGRLGERIRTDGGSHVLATGPSATADMGALVTGAHGPSRVHVVLVEP